MNNNLKLTNKDLFTCKISFLSEYFNKYEYPWEILPLIKDIIESILKVGLSGYTFLKPNVLIGKDVDIAPTAYIEGPAIIGNNVKIKPGAYIRNNVIIGDNSTIGNSSELKNSILLNNVQAPHYNYVGDSILGEHAHMGAGSICSNLKSDGKNVVIHAEKDYETNLRKVGSFLGDNVEIGCGSVLNPGTVIGKNSNVYPLTMLRGAYPANAIIKGTFVITQKNN